MADSILSHQHNDIQTTKDKESSSSIAIINDNNLLDDHEHDEDMLMDDDDTLPSLKKTATSSDSTDNLVNKEKLIIVTGFGPFIGHELVNASWEAVRILPSNFILNGIKYIIKKVLVCVEYEKVDEAVAEIWKENPMLVVHCGVHAGAKSIQLESLAYNNKFIRRDYARKRLQNATICLEKNGSCCEKICTKLNVNDIVEHLNAKIDQHKSTNTLIVSNDVGNYLCGYIYLKSLDMNCDRSLFIHVPPIDKPFTSEETSSIIYQVIQKCIEQIEEALHHTDDDDKLENCIL